MTDEHARRVNRFVRTVSFVVLAAVAASALVAVAFALSTMLESAFPLAFGEMPDFVMNIGPFLVVAVTAGSFAHLLNPGREQND